MADGFTVDPDNKSIMSADIGGLSWSTETGHWNGRGFRHRSSNTPRRVLSKSEGLSQYANSRYIVPGNSSRYALPGQAGYTDKSDHPVGVRNTKPDYAESRLVYRKTLGLYPDKQSFREEGLLPLYGLKNRHGDRQSWDTTAQQRISNSPRFQAAYQSVVDADPEFHADKAVMRGGGNTSVAGQDVLNPHDADNQAEMDKSWNKADMGFAGRYWKAHMSVQAGDYDHLADLYQDTVNARDPRPKVNNNLSSQFKLVPGFIN